MRLSAIALLAVATACHAPQAPVGGRVVSDNPCIDAILADVAAPEQIGAISSYSKDPASASVSTAWAARFAATQGTAEEIVAAHPRVFLTSSPANPATRAALARAGVPVIALPVPTSVDESIAQVRRIAAALGRRQAGEVLIARIMAATTPRAPLHRRALIYQGGGLVLGAHTLADDLLRRAGFENAARRYGTRPWDVQPVERVITDPPDLILAPAHPRGRDEPPLRAVRAALNHGQARVPVVSFDPKLLYCGAGPMIAASARLHEIAAR